MIVIIEFRLTRWPLLSLFRFRDQMLWFLLLLNLPIKVHSFGISSKLIFVWKYFEQLSNYKSSKLNYLLNGNKVEAWSWVFSMWFIFASIFAVQFRRRQPSTMRKNWIIRFYSFYYNWNFSQFQKDHSNSSTILTLICLNFHWLVQCHFYGNGFLVEISFWSNRYRSADLLIDAHGTEVVPCSEAVRYQIFRSINLLNPHLLVRFACCSFFDKLWNWNSDKFIENFINHQGFKQSP